MPTETPSPPAAPPARRFTDAAREDLTVLRAGLKVKGELRGTGGLELAGQFEGPLDVDGLCHLHETARVEGPVTAVDAVVEGELRGPLAARGKVELRATARVHGDIIARTVALAEGCHFEGHIRMKEAGGDGTPTSFQEKRRPRPTDA
jgi:cytoskeletal protein CcmA (bactofilin family)